jgi:hypothetical protein
VIACPFIGEYLKQCCFLTGKLEKSEGGVSEASLNLRRENAYPGITVIPGK